MSIVPKQRPDRSAEMDQFLARIGWEGAERRMLAGDASFRRYERVHHNNTVAVLMDAPPPWEDVRPFQHITTTLAKFGLSVPNLLAADANEGFLLLEDLGDHSFTKLLNANPERELELYQAAVAALVTIYRQSQAHLPMLQTELRPYDMDVYLREAGLFAEWFLPQVVGLPKARELRMQWLDLWRTVIKATPLQQSGLVHRDYHADNLFWLAGRQGHLAVGMIDYQDALLGDAAYDLASLLEDARRDVDSDTVTECYSRFHKAIGQDHAQFSHRYSVLAAQRNAKIIGIFTRLAVRDGKAHYLDLLPRVWGHFSNDLIHPALMPIRAFVEDHVPEIFRGKFAADVSIGGIAVPQV